MSRIADLHNDWLVLVDPQGPFLTLPVLKERLPQGLDRVDATTRAAMREEWSEAAEARDRTAWVWWLLADVLDWREDLVVEGLGDEVTCPVPEYDLTLRPDGALVDPDTGKPRVLVRILDPGTNPAGRGHEGWAATHIQRAARLGRHVDCPLSLVTNGDLFTLVYAPVGGATGWATWRSSWFSPEPAVLDSFITLLSARRFFTLTPEETPEALFEASASSEAEVTDTLGTQVRQAVELLVAAISRANRNRRGQLLEGIPPGRVYDAAATVLMRLVFLLSAEERRLLPLDDDLYATSYAVSTLRAQLEDDEVHHREQMEYRTSGWHRILALSRAVYGGITHENLRLPAYGGNLFDPQRFPFLEGRRGGRDGAVELGTEALPVDDLTMLHILRALQVLRFRYRNVTETRQLSYKALSVEQIGHVYERLLDHGTVVADGIVCALVGKSGDEPEIALHDIERRDLEGRDALIDWLSTKDVTGKTKRQVAKLLDGEVPEQIRKGLRIACDNDEDAVARLLPYANLLRVDLRGVPLVFLPGSHYVTETGSRREGGIEYTPRELADEIVEHALAPLCYSPGPADTADAERWSVRPSDEILSLKVCDPACGSGAFLVAATRYLSERLIEAWEGEGVAEQERSTAADDPSQIDLAVRARRLVVERCIYGVDRDHMAVDMGKLSLWLVTMAKDQPFTFLDHAVKCGDSLLGVTGLDQLRCFHLDPAEGRRIHDSLFDATEVIEPAIKEALEICRKLGDIEVRSVRDAETKAALHEEAEQRLETLHAIGDHLIGAYLSTAGESDSTRESRILGAAGGLARALGGGDERLASLRAQTDNWLKAGRRDVGPPRPPLHWPLAFPEVFVDRSDPGFDVVIGNPPFLGGKRISGPLGKDYREFLVREIAQGVKGNADLVAYFFLRAGELSSFLGLLATNTISQGDTREVGLDQLVDESWTIYRAVKSVPWAGEASLEIAKVWMTHTTWGGAFTLDDRRVNGITTLLNPAGRVEGAPHQIAVDGFAFQGSNLANRGFVLSEKKALDLIQADRKNAEVVRPYLGGRDLNEHPQQHPSRYVIDFRDWSMELAQRYAAPFEIVERNVRPTVEEKASSYRGWVERWWQFWNPRAGSYQRIETREQVLAIARVSNTVQPVLVSNNQVFDVQIVIFSFTNDFAGLALLSSGLHYWWVVTHGSKRGVGSAPRYTPSDVFETFPQPSVTPVIEEMGRALHERRSALMIDHDEGLTATYNRVHDPDDETPAIVRLRDLHLELDHAVAAAYGWEDLELGHGHYGTSWGTRFTFQPSVRQELLDRLLELNHERYAEEVAAGLRESERGKRRRRRTETPNLELFAEEDEG